MAHHSWLKLLSRLCLLVMLCTSAFYLWPDAKAVADSGTSCIQCDSNNATGQANCGSSLNSCIQSCTAQFPDDPIARDACINNCYNQYYMCTTSTWNTYDNCLYGFTDFSGLCSIVAIPGYPPPSGKGRTPCDFACRDQMLDCMANDGLTCGEDYNICKLSCG